MGNFNLVKAWRGLHERPEWVRLNIELLSKIANKGDDFITRVNDLYILKNFSKPSNLTPPGLYEDIFFNKFGFPDLKPHSLESKFYFSDNIQGNYTSDFRNATDWLKKQVGIQSVQELPLGSKTPKGSPILVILEGSNKAIKITWHHHQDGRTLMPVLSDIHDLILGRHTGGVATSARELHDLFPLEK